MEPTLIRVLQEQFPAHELLLHTSDHQQNLLSSKPPTHVVKAAIEDLYKSNKVSSYHPTLTSEQPVVLWAPENPRLIKDYVRHVQQIIYSTPNKVIKIIAARNTDPMNTFLKPREILDE